MAEVACPRLIRHQHGDLGGGEAAGLQPFNDAFGLAEGRRDTKY
jgi:hypothetical protein